MTREPRIRLLGAVTVRRDAGLPVAPARLDRVVLAHLALAAGRAVPAADLVEALWGATPPDGARNALQVKVSRLRRHLGADGAALRHRQGSYLLALDPDDVDLHRFTVLARTAHLALAEHRPYDARTAAQEALGLWQGPPLVALDEHPRLVAARVRAEEQASALRELLAEADLAEDRPADAVGTLRTLLAEDPLRPHARLLLMRALDALGRRADALAVYDVGRRLLVEHAGLAPPAALREEFERLLAAERSDAGRVEIGPAATGVPAGAADTARWLAREGSVDAAVELALRGSWWWWLGGRRTEGRDLLEELVGIAADTGGGDRRGLLGASAWLAVFDAVGAGAERAIAAGEDALQVASDLGWGRHDCLAAVLLAERLVQRGEPVRAARLLDAARSGFARRGDRWGLALVGLTAAKADLQRGAVAHAATGGRTALSAFEELDDPAGRMMAMDLLGYCAEVVGDLPAAARTHRRALDLARAVDAPGWQATQLTRLGSVRALLGSSDAAPTLRGAVALARSIGSTAGETLARNALGLAHGLGGDHDGAAEIHAATLDWYEQQASPAGISYTAARLALELGALGSPGARGSAADAAPLAERSVALARGTGDPRAIAHGLEAVALTHPSAPARARALGGARTLRRRTGSPLPAVVAAPLAAAERALSEELGDDLLPRMREGARAARHGLG